MLNTVARSILSPTLLDICGILDTSSSSDCAITCPCSIACGVAINDINDELLHLSSRTCSVLLSSHPSQCYALLLGSALLTFAVSGKDCLNTLANHTTTMFIKL